MKTASTELFDLIHSLSSYEKAYFRRYAGLYQSSNSNYLKLFDAIYKQKIYDEKALKEQFKNDKLASYFSRAKRYLHDKILEAMQLLYAEDTIERRLKIQIERLEFLVKKGLFKQALKKVQHIKKEAHNAESWIDYNTAIGIEIQIFIRVGLQGVDYEQLLQERELALWSARQYIDNLTEKFNQIQLSFLCLQNPARNPNFDEKPIEKLYQDILKNKSTDSIWTQITCLRSLALYATNYLQDREKAIEYYSNAVELLEQNIEKLQSGYDLYLSFLSRIVELSINLLSFERSQFYLQKIKDKIVNGNKEFLKNKALIIQAEFDYYYNSLFCYFFFGKHDEALKMLKISLAKMGNKLQSGNVYFKLQMNSMYMFIHFFQEQFSEALKYADAAMNLPIETHPMKQKIHIWHLFIHWELKNHDLLEHFIRSILRRRKKYGSVNVNEMFILKKMRQLLASNHEKKIWLEIYNHFNSLEISQENRNGYYVIQAYIASKLENQPMKEIHRGLVENQI